VSVVEAGRRAAEARMVDTCVIRYPTGDMVQDEGTGRVSPVYADRLTSRCRVQSRNLAARAQEVGGRTATTISLELHLPVSGTGSVRAGDVAEVTAVGPKSDAALLGRKYRVVGPVAESTATARRLDVEEVIS
jgi:hypothetical protein